MGRADSERYSRRPDTRRRVHTWVHPRLQAGYWTSGLGQPLSKLDFPLCFLLPYMSNPGEDVAWRQPQRQLV
jgi:hypothetical protein